MSPFRWPRWRRSRATVIFRGSRRTLNSTIPILLTFEIGLIVTHICTHMYYSLNLKRNVEYNKLGQLSNVVEQLLHNIGFALLLHQFHNAILVLYWFYIDFTAQWLLHWFYTTFTRNRNHICVVIIVHQRLCRSRSTTMHLRVRIATVCNNGRRLRGRGSG